MSLSFSKFRSVHPSLQADIDQEEEEEYDDDYEEADIKPGMGSKQIYPSRAINDHKKTPQPHATNIRSSELDLRNINAFINRYLLDRKWKFQRILIFCQIFFFLNQAVNICRILMIWHICKDLDSNGIFWLMFYRK